MVKKKRIEWIDAMRGFTMIMVVFNHVEHFGYGFEGSVGDLRLFFGLFRMPLFFFVSGFIAFKATQVFDAQETISCIIKKTKVQLIPTFVFGILFSTTIYANMRGFDNPLRGIGSMLIDSSKNGYWFTIVLLEMFIVYYITSFIATFCKKQSYLLPALMIESMAFCILSYLCTNDNIVSNGDFNRDFPTLVQLGINTLSINRLLYYFQWFVFGNFVARNKDYVWKLFENWRHLGYIIIAFVSLYITYREINCEILHNIIKLVLGYLGLVTVVAYFSINATSFEQNKFAGKYLQYIGKRTLDIYLIHFFLIPHLPMIGEWFIENPNIVIEFFVTTFISVLVIISCLVISSVIRVSPFLAHYLFGVRKS